MRLVSGLTALALAMGTMLLPVTAEARVAGAADAAWAARPSDPSDESGGFFWEPTAARAQACGVTACVHYVTTTSDAPPLTAADGVTPDWVRRNLEVAEHALRRMGELGYPSVPSDAGRGGTEQFDIYLADISSAGLYGYCVPETPVPANPRQASSFCVFDNDFVGFPMPPDESLRVTAAHELFHAVQFGMAVDEDRWFMESTATWMEEQVADDVNDNRQYLSAGQLGSRKIPLDQSSAGLGVYGNWIFFEFVSKRYGVDAIREIWQRAAGRDESSIEAIRGYVASRGGSFDRFYSAFVRANLRPRRAYDEGVAYRAAAVDNSIRLGPRRRTWRDQRIGVPHLTAHVVALRPGRTLGAGTRVRVHVTARQAPHTGAHLMVIDVDGGVRSLPIKLKRGAGDRVVRFAPGRVRKVLVVVSNASTGDNPQRVSVAANAVGEHR